MAYKRFYLLGSVSLVVIFSLIAPFIEYYYGYENETYCKDKCFVKFCLKNGNKDLYFYNKAGLPLTFQPEDKVNNVRFFVKDGRIKKGDYIGYREIDFINPYSKGVSYVFKIPAYTASCYAMEVKKDWWADVKWTFGKLDPLLISGTQIGNKIVKEECEPSYTTNTIPYYESKFNKANSSYDKILKYAKETIQTECIKTGKVNISGKITSYNDFFCKIEGTDLICISEKEGGRYNVCKPDGSVTCYRKSLINDSSVFYNSLKTKVIV